MNRRGRDRFGWRGVVSPRDFHENRKATSPASPISYNPQATRLTCEMMTILEVLALTMFFIVWCFDLILYGKSAQ